MNVKKVNDFFGYGLFTVGALKILLVILAVIQFGTNVLAIFNGGNVNSESYPILSTAIGIAEFILAIGSIIMIIVNIKKQPEVINGYLLGIGAVLVELITPGIFSLYAVFVECGMYMKAGTKIRNENYKFKERHKTSRETIKNTEWFFSEESEKDKKNEKNEQIEIKQQKRRAKLEEEIHAWKELLDSGEIDEITYNQETNKLIEKEKRRSERDKKN